MLNSIIIIIVIKKNCLTHRSNPIHVGWVEKVSQPDQILSMHILNNISREHFLVFGNNLENGSENVF